SETAALSLGVLGRPMGVLALCDLLAGGERAGVSIGRAEVPTRTRVFAAYGLGLAGERTRNEDVRRYIVHHLTHAFEQDRSGAHDLRSACLTALGCVPIPAARSASVAPAAAQARIEPLASLESELDWLESAWKDRELPELVRAHVPASAAKLAA